MVSPFSPPVLYLTDDDDDNETEQNLPYASSFTSVINDNLPRKKRKYTNADVRINPSLVNWSKRQRNDYYRPPQPTHNSHHHEPETVIISRDKYNLPNQESHSFHAFDWTTEPRTSTRIYSNPIQPTTRVSIAPPPPPPNVMNVVKHHLDHSDTVPLIPITHQNDRYLQYPHRKSTNVLISATPPPAPLPLPLPTPTSSLVRPQAQRIQPGKNTRIPYTHAVSLNFSNFLFKSEFILYKTSDIEIKITINKILVAICLYSP
jgi:hypothetical protein